MYAAAKKAVLLARVVADYISQKLRYVSSVLAAMSDGCSDTESNYRSGQEKKDTKDDNPVPNPYDISDLEKYLRPLLQIWILIEIL